ncbi:MAG: c-type cytochrome biogenesis protein CcmF, partial [Burkholderiales bacterium]|nr:c-type cytochrome biogenesis protein CcmF [Burkholderiales bacterium]
FSLSLLGTFLVRSGVLSSVHAFATDPRRGLFILIFLVVVIGSSLALFAWRAPKVGLGQRFGLLSRESLLLVNNMMLAVSCSAVLLGTLYPLFLDALGLNKISVGPPYFDTVFGLLMAPLVAVMGVGPITRWKQDEGGALVRKLWIAAIAAVLAALLVEWLAGGIHLWTTGGLTMAFWIVASLLVDLRERLLPPGGKLGQIGFRAGQLPRAMLGMMVAHFGVAAFAFGVAMVKTYAIEKDVKMGTGDHTEIGGYSFRMTGLADVTGPNYQATRATIEVSRGAQRISVLHPEKRIYRVQQQPMTEAAVDRGLTRDLYISMGEQLPSGAWIVRVQDKPFIAWIWGGCLIMMVGGMLAMADRRYRVPRGARQGAGAAIEGIA